jgi:hypothetical protein
MLKRLHRAFAFLHLLLIATTAVGQTVPLRCEHRSGAFQDQVWSVIVDFSDRSARLNGDLFPADISDQYITLVRRYPNLTDAIRIDRVTGQMQFSMNNAPWDTRFGMPGVICQPQKRIGE